MPNKSERTTVYLSPSVRASLRRRLADVDQTMSEYVDQAVALSIAEDLEDLELVKSRLGGVTESLEDFLAAIKRDGLI